MSDRLNVRARVTVTIEVDVNSTWSHDTTMDQVHRQGPAKKKEAG